MPPGSVELGAASPPPRRALRIRPRAVDAVDAPTQEEPPVAADGADATPPPTTRDERPAANAAPAPTRDELTVVAAAPLDDIDGPLPSPADLEAAVVAPPSAAAAPPDDSNREIPDNEAKPPARASPRSVLLVPDQDDVELEDDQNVLDDALGRRLGGLRDRGYLAFYDRPPLMTVALVASWCVVQQRRGYEPYNEDAYCLGPGTPFDTVFAHAYAHLSRAHLASNVISMLLVGGVLEAVEGPWCVLCIFACAVPCGAAYHSLWKPQSFVRGASGGVYGIMAAHVSTMAMNWYEMPLRYLRLLFCVLVLACELAGRYWYRQPHLGYAVHCGGAIGGAAAALVLVRNVRLRCHEFAFVLAGLAVYAASALAVLYVARDARPALGMALVSAPLLAQFAMTSCSYDGDDSVLEPGARVFDLSAWKALCRGRPRPSVDGDEGVV